jgi:hypothetical protein
MSEDLYSELSLPRPDLIRLFRLLPPSEKDPDTLRGELFKCALQRSDKATRPYEALSYVWYIPNSENTPQRIIINNQLLEIKPNLYTALLHLRDPGIPRILWVDAICIYIYIYQQRCATRHIRRCRPPILAVPHFPRPIMLAFTCASTCMHEFALIRFGSSQTGTKTD